MLFEVSTSPRRHESRRAVKPHDGICFSDAEAQRTPSVRLRTNDKGFEQAPSDPAPTLRRQDRHAELGDIARDEAVAWILRGHEPRPGSTQWRAVVSDGDETEVLRSWPVGDVVPQVGVRRNVAPLGLPLPDQLQASTSMPSRKPASLGVASRSFASILMAETVEGRGQRPATFG
ncbi:MAG: hypothetical protein ABI355_15945 [Solirubrobacteraceae bacterium]